MKTIALLAGFFCVVNCAFTQTKTITKAKPKPTTAVKQAKIPIAVKDTGLYVKITTDSGIIILKLYDETPMHRDNFAKLVRSKFYDSLLWHRVMPTFMIQGGDPASKYAAAGVMLGGGDPSAPKIPAEINDQFFHKKGALGAASDGNPEKKSSASQFYIVDGKTYGDPELDAIEQKNNRKFSPAVREIYKTRGGAAHLDGNYTVFGEIISGFKTVAKIGSMSRDRFNRPLTDIRMKMEILRNIPKLLPED